MSLPDRLLMDLYHTAQDPELQGLAARHAPILRFDEREPFLPLAAGYTVFTADGRSPSMERDIRLSPPRRRPAVQAIEYAIWWDWDIHHLYELEHAWIYLDGQGTTVRVEASWHGDFHNIPVQLEGGRAVLLSEPGKHAFAPVPAWFRKRASEYRRVETQAVAAHAHVLINQMFAGKIRQRVFDQTLVRSYLVQQAFEPSWNFSKAFSFRPEWLVPWPVLNEWIPRRVNALLEQFEHTIPAERYRALHLASAGTSMPELRAAAQAGADALFLPLCLSRDRLRLDRTDSSPDIEEVTRFCRSEPVTAVCQPADLAAVERLAGFVRQEKVQNFLAIASPEPTWLTRYKELAQGGITVLQLPEIEQDPLPTAKACGARFVQPLWEGKPGRREALTAEWVARVHQAGLGIMSWPVAETEECQLLQGLGLDTIWQDPFPAC